MCDFVFPFDTGFDLDYKYQNSVFIYKILDFSVGGKEAQAYSRRTRI